MTDRDHRLIADIGGTHARFGLSTSLSDISNTTVLACADFPTLEAAVGHYLNHHGIYIGGGIIPKLGNYFFRSPFRQRFDDKGRFSEYLSAIPVFVINSANPALLGAAAYMDHQHYE